MRLQIKSFRSRGIQSDQARLALPRYGQLHFGAISRSRRDRGPPTEVADAPANRLGHAESALRRGLLEAASRDPRSVVADRCRDLILLVLNQDPHLGLG